MPTSKEIGQRVRELRGKRGFRSTAAQLGISSSSLAMYERGERIPRDEVKSKIAKFYGQTVQVIFFDD